MGIYIELSNFEVPKRLIFLKANIKYGASNYSEMVQELKDFHEMTAEKIAFILRISGASTVVEWVLVGVLNYDNGEALIELWENLTDKKDQDIARTDYWSV